MAVKFQYNKQNGIYKEHDGQCYRVGWSFYGSTYIKAKVLRKKSFCGISFWVDCGQYGWLKHKSQLETIQETNLISWLNEGFEYFLSDSTKILIANKYRI